MNGFLAGVVRRGAGLPSPVMMRPAIAPYASMEAPPVTAQPGPEDARPSSPGVQTSASEAPPVVGSPMTMRPGQSLSFPVPAPVPLRPAIAPQQTPMDLRSVTPQPGREDVTLNAPDSRRAHRIERNEDAAATVTMRSGVAVTGSMFVTRPPSVDSDRPRAGSDRRAQDEPAHGSSHASLASAIRSALEAGTKPREQKPEPTVALQPPVRTSASSAPRSETESRNIQVKIGKVEIRSTQPVPAAPPPRSPARSGFDDFTLARNYLDRGQR